MRANDRLDEVSIFQKNDLFAIFLQALGGGAT